MLLFPGIDGVKDLFQYVGGVIDSDAYVETIQNINDGLSSYSNSIVQCNLHIAIFPQGSDSFGC